MIVKLTLKKIRRFILFLILLLGVGFVGYRIGVTRIGSPVEGTDLSLFWLVWHRLETKYLDRENIDSQKMIEGAISGMVASLDDPYTVFLRPDDNKMNKEDLAGKFGGVGIQLGYKDEVLAVISPLKGTPAEKAGIKAGDLILKIKDDGKKIDRSTSDISLPEAVKIIRGKEGTIVTLTLMRKEVDKPFDSNIARGRISVPALESHWEEKNGERFAYVHLLQFTEQMNQDWLKWAVSIEQVKNQSDFGGVILDLRNNPGGYLQGAVFVAGEFLPRGKVIVWQEDREKKRTKFVVDRQGRLLDVPLVVLVNNGSASAAEILAGALDDYQKAEVVGTKTFGKGTIQEPEELPGGAGLHITIAKWLLPNGRSIHKDGIEPTIKVDLNTVDSNQENDLILERGIDTLLK